jgi:hypothetical protein
MRRRSMGAWKYIEAWKYRGLEVRGVGEVSRRGSFEEWKYRGAEVWKRGIMEVGGHRGVGV